MSERQAPPARGVEIRLLRRLPALAARLRGRTPDASPARSTSPIFPKRRAPSRTGPYDLSLVEGSITTAHDAERIQRGAPRNRSISSRSAPAPPPAASRRCAISPTSNDFIAAVYASPQLHRDARDVDADLGSCGGRLSSCTAVRSTRCSSLEVISAFLAGRKPAIAAHSVCIECKQRGTVCVMVQGTPCLGPGDACRLRRDLSGVPARLLRLLWSDGDAEHRRAGARMAGARRDATRHSACFPYVQRRRRSVPQRERGPWRLRRSGSTISPASRAKARSTFIYSDGRVTSAQLAIFEPPRFFEAFLRGRGYAETPDIVARICGICPIAYQMGAVHAIENALRRQGRRPASGAAAAASIAANGSKAMRSMSSCCMRRIFSAFRCDPDGARAWRRRPQRPRAEEDRQ